MNLFGQLPAGRYAIYVRKSQEDGGRQVQSIEDQTAYCVQKAKDCGIQVVDIIEDTGTGTKPGTRPGFKKMIERIETGEIDGIICWKIDRLARNPIDDGLLKWLLMQKKIKHIIASDREIRPEDNQIIVGLDFSAATQYSIELSRNVKRGLGGKIHRGQWIARAPIGYQNFGIAKGAHWVDKDIDRWELVKRCWESFATGNYSVPDVQRLSIKWGLTARETRKTPPGKSVSESSFYKMFANLFYMGKMMVKGQIHDAEHPAMVSSELFYRVQEVLRVRGSSHYVKPKSKEFIFAGMVKCGECGCTVVCEDKIKYSCDKCKKYSTASNHVPPHCPLCKAKMGENTFKKATYHSYAHCTGANSNKKACAQTAYSTGRGKSSVPLSELETQVDRMLTGISFDDDVLAYCKELLRSEHFQNIKISNDIYETAKKEHQNAIKELGNLVDMKLKGQLDDEMYGRKKAELEKKRDEAAASIPKEDKKSSNWLAQTEDFIDLAFRAREIFRTGEISLKKEILRSVASHIFLKGGILHFEFKKPFDVLLKPLLDENTEEVHCTAPVCDSSFWLGW